MKKRNLRMIKCAWLIAMVLMAFNARAATTLYWRGTGSAGGVLSAGTNFNGSFWSTAMSGAGSVTNAIANNDLVINMNAAAGNYTNLTSTAVSIASLMLNNSGACGLTTTFTGNLTVSGAITINGNMTNPNNNGNTGWIQFVINSGVTVQCGSYTAVNGSVANGNNYILARINGTLVCTGNLSLSSSTTVATFIGGSSNADQMQIGDGNSTGVLSVGGTTTVTTNANTGGGLIVGISVNSPSTATFNGDMNLGSAGSAISRIYNEEGTTINFNGANVTIGGAGAMGGNSVGGNVVFDRNGAQTFTVNSTVNNCQMGALFIGSSNSPTVTVAGSGNIYLTNPYHYDASFNQVYDPAIVTIKAGATLDLGTQTMNFTSTGSTATLTVNGTLKLAGANNFPGSFNTYTLAPTSTVEYNGTIGQYIATLASPGYGNLVLTGGSSSSFAKTLLANTVLQGDLTVNSTAYMNASTFSIARNAAGGTFTIADGGIFATSATTAATDFPVNFSTFNPNTTGDYRYLAAGGQPVKAAAYGQLTMIGGTSGDPKTFLGSTTSNSLVTINTGAFVDLGSSTITSAVGTPALTQNGYLKAGAVFPSGYTFSSGASSTVEYNGSVAQVLSAQTYNNLIFNNSNGTFSSTASTSVDKVATFTAGVLNNRSSGTAGALKFISTATAVSASTTSYVSGYVAKTGATAFTYPVGDIGTTAGSAFHTLAITAPTASITPIVSYVSSSPSSTIGTNLNIIHTIDPSAYWTMASAGSATATATVTILTRDETSVFMPGAQVFVAGFNIAQNYWEQLGNLGTTATGDQQSLSTSAPVVLSNYSAFTVGSTTYILPITLTSFTGTASGCMAGLAWQTSTESNSSYYAVEAGTDATIFTQVGKVASKNSATGASYSYNYALGSGTSYFRLKAVGSDGKFTYSQVVAVTGTGACGTSAVSVKVSPNPTSNVINIQGLATGSRVGLYNVSGQKMTEMIAAGNSQSIDLGTFANGVYILRIQATDGSTSSVRVVKD